ncbi:MAG TPA: serine/threonine-protein kinase, partial [Verrucomicrobiae bacterium]|nr:serine/threonine-protein kinase [Verrucomicrobiae bacterium]
MDEVLPVVHAHVLIRPIGKGGFGEVWLARNVVGTYRAAKIVSRASLEREGDFRRELNGIQKFEPVSRLHDGLVDVLQIGHAADETYFYYVMELGDDVEPRQEFAVDDYQPRTLTAECHRRNRIPANETALIGAQLAAALEFLHQNGLIHRDIKPSNVLFVGGHAKIGDPGLVAAIEGQHTLGGTLGYIPPEGPGTPQADIFSLGKLLYVITTGKGPGEYPRLPPEMMTFADAKDLQRLNLVILRACAYDPSARYATAEELRKDLLGVHAGGSPEETRRRLRLARNIGLILLVLLTLVAAGLYRTWRQARAERARFAESLLETAKRNQAQRDPLGAMPYLGEVLTIDGAKEEKIESAARLISFAWRYSPRLLQQWVFTNAINQVAAAPNGHDVAIASASGQVWLWPWRTGPPRLLGEHRFAEGRAEAEAVAFSHDDQWLASIGLDATVRAWHLATGTNISIRVPAPGRALAFRPKTLQLVAGCEGSVVLIDLETGDVKELHNLGIDSAISVAIHPDRNTVLVGTTGRAAGIGRVYKLFLDGTLAPRPTNYLWVYDLAFNSNATYSAAATGNRAHLNPLDPGALARLRHPTLVRSVSFNPREKDRLLTACIDGTVRLWSCDEDDQVMSPVHTPGLPSCVRFHPDGQTFTVATIEGLVRVYGLGGATNDVVRELTTISGDSMHYARVRFETNVVVRNATTERLEAAIAIPGDTINMMRLDQTGQRLMTWQANDHQIQLSVWDVNRAALIATTNLPPPLEPDLSPDGRSLTIRLTDRLILWLLDSNQSFQWNWGRILRDPWDNSDLRFSQNSPRAVVSWSTNVMVFSRLTGAIISRWSVRHTITSVDINGDGNRVAVGESPSGITSASIYVWEPETPTS